MGRSDLLPLTKRQLQRAGWNPKTRQSRKFGKIEIPTELKIFDEAREVICEFGGIKLKAHRPRWRSRWICFSPTKALANIWVDRVAQIAADVGCPVFPIAITDDEYVSVFLAKNGEILGADCIAHDLYFVWAVDIYAFLNQIVSGDFGSFVRMGPIDETAPRDTV